MASKLVVVFVLVLLAVAALASAQAPAAAPKSSASAPIAAPSKNKLNNSALTPFAAVPPSEDDTPSTDDNDDEDEVAPAGSPDASYPASDAAETAVSDGSNKTDEKSGVNGIKVAFLAVVSVTAFAGYVIF